MSYQDVLIKTANERIRNQIQLSMYMGKKQEAVAISSVELSAELRLGN